MLRFRRYDHGDSLGHKYIFGLNIYRDRLRKLPTVDLIIGRKVYVWTWDK